MTKFYYPAENKAEELFTFKKVRKSGATRQAVEQPKTEGYEKIIDPKKDLTTWELNKGTIKSLRARNDRKKAPEDTKTQQKPSETENKDFQFTEIHEFNDSFGIDNPNTKDKKDIPVISLQYGPIPIAGKSSPKPKSYVPQTSGEEIPEWKRRLAAQNSAKKVNNPLRSSSPTSVTEIDSPSEIKTTSIKDRKEQLRKSGLNL